MNYNAESNGVIDPTTARNLLQEPNNRPAAEKASFWFSKRFFVVILLFFGYFIMILFELNMSPAIVEMTSMKKTFDGNGNKIYAPEYKWSSSVITLLLYTIPFGNILSFLGLPVVNALGGAVTVGISVTAIAIINVLTPAILWIDFVVFLVSRIIIGVLHGIAYIGSMEMLSHWVPAPERSTMMSICLTGRYLGLAVSYTFSQFMTRWWSWRIMFYVSGAAGLIWSGIWLLVVKNTPSEDKQMSPKELSYILENTEKTSRNQVVRPYMQIFSSPAVWAMGAGVFASNWETWMIDAVPVFLIDTHGTRGIEEIYFITLVWDLIVILLFPVFGLVIDFCQNSRRFTIIQILKTTMSAQFISTLTFFAISSVVITLALFDVYIVFVNLILLFNHLTLQLICLSMVPTHTSVLAAILQFVSSVTFFAFMYTERLIFQNSSAREWRISFLTSAAISFAGAVIVCLFGSTKLQLRSLTTSRTL